MIQNYYSKFVTATNLSLYRYCYSDIKKKEKGGFGKFYRVAFEDGDVQTLGYFDILHGLFEESRVPVDVREKLDTLISNKQWNKTRFLTKGIAVEDLLELQESIAF